MLAKIKWIYVSKALIKKYSILSFEFDYYLKLNNNKVNIALYIINVQYQMGQSQTKDNEPSMTFEYKIEKYAKLTKDNSYSILNNFCTKYFNPNYAFSIQKNALKNKNLSISDIINNIQNDSDIGILFSKFNYENEFIEIDSKYDPGLLLLKELHFDNVCAKIKISDCGTYYYFTPNRYMPTHWIALIRDLIENRLEIDKKCIHLYNSLSSDVSAIKINKVSYLWTLPKQKYEYIEAMSFDDLMKIVTKVLKLNSVYAFFQVVPTAHTLIPNSLSYYQNNTNYRSDDFIARNINPTKLCDVFVEFACKQHSYMGSFSYSHAVEGGFGFDFHHKGDPLVELLWYSNLYTFTRFDIRGNTVFLRQHGTNLWYLLLLNFWIKKFGVRTTPLTVPGL